MKSKIDLCANVAIVVLSITVSVILIQNRLNIQPPPAPKLGFQVGQVLDLPVEALSAESGTSLLLAVAPDCGYCQRSMPFYRRIVDERDALELPSRIVAIVGAESHVEQERLAFSDEGIQIDAILSTDFQEMGILGTPVLLAVDFNGEVQGAWMGHLEPDQEQEVLRTLGIRAAS